MTMKVQCTECGRDCSNSYATHKGDPYHFGCIPLNKPRVDRAEASPFDLAISKAEAGQ